MASVGKEGKCIVIDNGTGTVRAGFANDAYPKLTVPNVICKSQYQAKPNLGDYGEFLGYKCPVVMHPMDRGVFCRSRMEEMWHSTFLQLLGGAYYDLAEHPVFMTERPLTGRYDEEWMISELFERFNVPSAFIANQATMAAYASGCLTGLVVDSGYGITHAVPVYEGHSLPYAVQHSMFGGHDVSLFLEEKLQRDKDFASSTFSRSSRIQNSKHRLCYVQKGPGSACRPGDADEEDQYELPGGETFSLSDERFEVPECLFKPSNFGANEHLSLPELACKSYALSGEDMREKLHSSPYLILSGGNTLFRGCDKRMAEEVNGGLPSSQPRFRVLAPQHRDLSAWTGTSVLASFCDHNLLIRREEYDEVGPHITLMKCFT